jgi:uncharacterized membrane protein
MLGRSKTKAIKKEAANKTDLALALARDEAFRSRLASALAHSTRASVRAAKTLGTLAVASRLVADKDLRRDLAAAVQNAQGAWKRVEKKRSHKLRNTLLVVAGGAAAAGLYRFRERVPGLGGASRAGISTIDESIDVDVPVSTAYNQWTQFEDFPLFMEGIDHVDQRDDTRIHWVATVAGRTAEWDAKILEQKPDSQISWISEDGKKTRGTVSFEPLGDSRTRIHLSMSYKIEGALESVGSTAGLDAQRVRSDLQRFKELIESRGEESGAWRSEVSGGKTQSPS